MSNYTIAFGTYTCSKCMLVAECLVCAIQDAPYDLINKPMCRECINRHPDAAKSRGLLLTEPGALEAFGDRFTPMTDHPTLGQTGQLYITLAAATAYGDAQDLRPGEAQRELTELLQDARYRREGPEGGEYWRLRSSALGLQLDATVVREGRLVVVTSVRVEENRR